MATRRIRTNWLLPVTGALCAVALAAAPASAFRGGDGGRGGGGRSASRGARPSGSAPGVRPSASRPAGARLSDNRPSGPAGRAAGDVRGGADRGRDGRPGIQGQDRGGRNVPGDRIGRSFPSSPTTGSRLGGNRGVAQHGRGAYRGHSGDDHRYRSGHNYKYKNGHDHKHKHGHGHDDDCDGGYWYRPYWWYPGSYYHYSYVVPAPIFVTTPFFCGLCSIGFAGDTYFHHHLHYVHALPFADIDSYLFAADGRIVFNGW